MNMSSASGGYPTRTDGSWRAASPPSGGVTLRLVLDPALHNSIAILTRLIMTKKKLLLGGVMKKGPERWRGGVN